MFYREAGVFKTSYAADQAVFPIPLDRWFIAGLFVLIFAVMPFLIYYGQNGMALEFLGASFWVNAILVPFLVYSLAAIGLNVLTGYCGLLSLGTGGFLAVGAYSSYKLMTMFPDMSIIFVFLLSGAITAAVGMVFGLPSLRIKGFYLAVATLAAQFFLIWLFYKVPWFYNYNATGQITVPPRNFLGIAVTGPSASLVGKYLLTLSVVVAFAFLTKNLVRSHIGRSWMAIRDMDIAAELIGIRPLVTKLTAFGVSSFLVGVAGAMMFCIYLGAAESGETFGIQQSFDILFMIIIGGLGTIMGAFFGAAFLVLLPIFLEIGLVDGLGMSTAFAEHMKFILLGSLIIFFLIVEPHGFARLWQIAKEKLRLWPFPH
ncbi:MAG: branched-chain amino acid ABC transporter permease [Hyphomicrobiaceae bacterium]